MGSLPAKIKDAYLARGKAYAKIDNLTLALEDFGKVIEMDRRSDEGYRQRASIYTALNKHDLALADLNKVLELEGRLFTQFKFESLLARAQTLIKLAEVEENSCRADQKQDLKQDLIENGQNTTSSPYSIAAICQDLRDNWLGPFLSYEAKEFIKRAIEDFTMALEQEPQNTEVLIARAQAYIGLGNFTNALRDVDEALVLNPRASSMLLCRAMILRQQNASPQSLQQALDILKNVISNSLPMIAAEAYFRRARLYIEDEQFENAIQELTCIINLFPKAIGEEKDTGSDYMPDEQIKPFSLLAAKDSAPIHFVFWALLARARLHMKCENYSDAVDDYTTIESISQSYLPTQLECRMARERHKKSELDKSNEALNWLLKHATEEDNKKNSKSKKKKKGIKQDNFPKRVGTPSRPPAIVINREEAIEVDSKPTHKSPQSPSLAEEKTSTAQDKSPPRYAGTPTFERSSLSPQKPSPTSTQVLSSLQSRSASASPKKVHPEQVPTIQKSAQKISPTSIITSQRSSTPSSRPVYTRDEACESLYEEVDTKTVVPSRPQFHFSLTDNLSEKKDAEDFKSGASEDDDEKSDGRSTPAASPVLIVDDKYLKKRRKQLEKLRADLIDVVARREYNQIVDALDRATRKQMLEQLAEECEAARNVLEELKLEKKSKPSSPQRRTPTTSTDTSPVRTALSVDTHTKQESKVQSVPPKPAMRTPERAVNGTPQAAFTTPQATNTTPQLKTSPVIQRQNDASEDIARLRYQLELMQRSLQEKQHEIEQLKRSSMMLPASSPLPLSTLSHKLHGMERCMRPLASIARESPALRHIDLMVNLFGPTIESERVRAKLMQYLRFILEPVEAISNFFPSGSYPLKTYLPDSDIDVCLVLSDDKNPTAVATWHSHVTQALMAAATQEVRSPEGTVLAPLCTVRNVTFVNAEVRVVKCTIDNVSIDLTANRFGALGAVSLIHEMDVRVGHDHLFKRSLILIKTWCMYDSSRYIGGLPSSAPRSNILGAVAGALSTFALNTMVLCIFNIFHRRISHPLQALLEFFHYYADFDWQYNAASMFGHLPINTLNSGWRPSIRSSELIMDEDAVNAYRATIETMGSGATRPSLPFQVRACNVVDPLNECNNVARSVTVEKLNEMKQAFQNGRQALVQMFYDSWHHASSAKKEEVQAEDIIGALDPRSLETFFLNGWQTYGSGYRPDLLVHPRQVWHSPAMSPFGDANTKHDVLQTQVPELIPPNA
ncbi:hypothetical protein THRCLA_09453 [Thraustotheca clavata]|uniref:Uncharacterized protein n=1 Tax=Thraustotheca clavata TaxID=74557 RepID=A0A1V9YWG7_9STRA|nr:hypothetical protein THRCLA_09453 [Thraustotheca clavata]